MKKYSILPTGMDSLYCSSANSRRDPAAITASRGTFSKK
jgi:hypothetical protein